MRFLYLAVPGLWLFFPVGLLSSLSAESKWIVFRSSIVGVMLRVFPSTLMFYILTSVLAVGTAALWYAAVFKEGGLALVMLAGPVGAAAFLIYARLLGRLSMMIHRRNPSKAELDDLERAERQRKKKKRRPVAVDSPTNDAEEGDRSEPLSAPADDAEAQALALWQKEARQETRPADPEDPDLDLPAPIEVEDDLAPPETKESDDEFPLKPLERDEAYENRWKDELDEGPVDPYVLNGEAPLKVPEYHHPDEDDIDDMGPVVPAERRTGEGVATHLDEPRARRRRKFKPPIPAPIGPSLPWWDGIYTFPFYATTVGAWLWLSLGMTVFGLLCRLMVGNSPQGE